MGKELRRWSQIESDIAAATSDEELARIQARLSAKRGVARAATKLPDLSDEELDTAFRADANLGKFLYEATRLRGRHYAEEPSDRGDRPHAQKDSLPKVTNPTSKQEAERESGVSRKTLLQWSKQPEIPSDKMDSYVARCVERREYFTPAGVASFLRGGAHVSHNSGNNEWYTPKEYVDAARKCMGGIDLDPASTKDANEVVRARKFYSEKDNGLAQNWSGRVWMNPPYGKEIIGKFCDKLVESVKSGAITQAVVLVNNATETMWWQSMASIAAAVCFVRGRIRFWYPKRESFSPLQGQSFLYYGKSWRLFAQAFNDIGIVLRK